ncbi:protein O-linked-mannose beta-1,2-N-acetylglucosaminyltransferase 1-like [Macrobrachium nipponense]|uniref:protein O-linked-mannose beta-1,2-N-acetylglucosaminyltransferase 1-like n=1 Tax=Macrobrachium nipponense TaxID=159736 RepID=UPI0030C8A5B7
MGCTRISLKVWLLVFAIHCYTRAAASPPPNTRHKTPAASVVSNLQDSSPEAVTEAAAMPVGVPPASHLDKSYGEDDVTRGTGRGSTVLVGVAVWSGWHGSTLRIHRWNNRRNNVHARARPPEADLEPVSRDDNGSSSGGVVGYGKRAGVQPPQDGSSRTNEPAPLATGNSPSGRHQATPAISRKTPHGQLIKPKMKVVDSEEFCSAYLRGAVDTRKEVAPLRLMNDTPSSDKFTRDKGVVLYVINQRTAQIILHKVFPLGEYWAHWADLQWHIQRIHTGRLVVLTVSSYGASGLRKTANILASLGSAFALHLTMYAQWNWVFIKGGKTISETVILNGKGSHHLHTALHLTTWVKVSKEQENSLLSYVRLNFCEKQGGMGDLCSEENAPQLPFPPSPSLDEATMKDLAGIPIIITAGNRHQYLYYTLTSILKAPGVHSQNILAILGDATEATMQLLCLLNVNFTTILSEGEGNRKLFRYYRKVYDFVYRNFPNSVAAIFLDEDVKVSPDFFSFMGKTIRLLKEDPTLYCINGFSATGFSGLAHDPCVVLRARVQVEWGYAISLPFIKEALNQWPLNPEESDTLFYDEWLYRHVSGKRECLFPEVSRTNHFGMGTNTNAYNTEAYFLSMPLVNISNVPLKGLDSLILPQYNSELKRRILTATLLTGSPCRQNFIPITTQPTDFVFYYSMTKDDNGNPIFLNFFYTAKCLNAWALSDQGLHDLVLTVKTSPTTTVFLVGAPYSPYGHLCPTSVKPWNFNSLQDQEHEELIEKIKHLELGNYKIPNTSMNADNLMEMLSNNNKKQKTQT